MGIHLQKNNEINTASSVAGYLQDCKCGTCSLSAKLDQYGAWPSSINKRFAPQDQAFEMSTAGASSSFQSNPRQ